MSPRTSTRSYSVTLGATLVACLVSWMASPCTFAGSDIAQDVPAEEISLDAPLPSVQPNDRLGSAFGVSDGGVCALMIEDLRLRAAYSANGGATFGGETDVAGSSGQNEVKDYAAAMSADGRVYAAAIVVDPGGDLGLEVMRSDDMCLNWTSPATLDSNDSFHGVRSVSVATGSAGFVAVVFRGNLGVDPFAVVSTDFGATWTTPVRLDPGVTPGNTPSTVEDVAVDAANDNVYVAFSQDRGPGSSVWFTRSVDDGVSFSAEQSLDSVLSAQAVSWNPDINVAGDGSVLIALWDRAGNDHLYVVRSTDQGVSYGQTLDQGGSNSEVPLVPRLFASPAGTVLLTYVDEANGLQVLRSANNGATFGGAQTLVSTVAGSSDGTRDLSEIDAVRTGAGTWAIAWSDERDDSYARLRTDVYIRTSTDDGVNWSSEQRVDSDTAGAMRSWLAALAASSTDDLFVMFEEDRRDNGRSADFFGNVTTAASPSFGSDYRVDTDAGEISPEVLFEPALATDGVSHVYVAFSAYATGPETDIHIAASADGGYSFGAPVRVGGSTAGSRIEALPVIGASSDGNVYVAFISDNPGGNREILFNHSADFGQTWQVSDRVLDTLAQGPGYFADLDWPGLQLVALPGGVVYVVWSDEVDVYLARSANAGVDFTIEDVDQDSRGFNRFPRLCAQGSQIVLVWIGADVAFVYPSVWGIVSTDSEKNWSSAAQLRTEGSTGGVDVHALACDGGSGAVTLWPDGRGPRYRLYSSRFNGATWTADAAVTGPNADQFLPVATYASGSSNVVVAYEDFQGSVFASRSTDGGVSFPSYQRLDTGAPDAGAGSILPRIVSDGGPDVWIAWLEESPGLAAFVVRHSSDGGANYGAVRRLDRKTPQGGFENLYFDIGAATPAALPGAALFTWSGERDSSLLDVLFNVVDLNDADRDLAATSVDCDDADPTVQAVPTAVTGLAIQSVVGLPAPTRLSWDSQTDTAGSSTTADLVSGSLADLRTAGGFGSATCLVSDHADTAYQDLRPDPAAGTGFYYLVRLANACGTGSYGDSTLPTDPRDDLDTAGPCP